MTLDLAHLLRYGALFTVYCAWTDVLPGVLIAAWLSRFRKRPLRSECAAALALLFGLSLHLILWGTLRWQNVSYPAIQAVHAAIAISLSLACLEKRARHEAARIGRSFFSKDALLFLVIASAIAASLTYGKIEHYDPDELLRMSFAGAAIRSFPAQNPLVWKGILKYHYLCDFFAGMVSAETGIPLPFIYFRYLLIFNWFLLYVGLRGVLRHMRENASNFWAVCSFILLFSFQSDGNPNLVYRENTFALGVAALCFSCLWTGFAEQDFAALLLAAASAGTITFSKAPCGCLYTAYVFFSAFLFARFGKIRWRTAIATAATAALTWLLFYRGFLTSDVLGKSASTLKIGLSPGTLEIFFPWLLHHRVSSLMSSVPIFDVAYGELSVAGNILTLCVYSLLPLWATAAYAQRQGLRRFWTDSTNTGLFLKSAWATFLVAAVFYTFIHYRVSQTSDSYWVYFGLWLLSIVSLTSLCSIPDFFSLPKPLLKTGALILFFLLASLPHAWRKVRLFADYPRAIPWSLETWTPGHMAACSYLNAQAPSDALFIHNVMDYYPFTMSAFCNRRMFVSFTAHDGVWENPAVYDPALVSARMFFDGTMPHPLEWLHSQGIQYVYWDLTPPPTTLQLSDWNVAGLRLSYWRETVLPRTRPHYDFLIPAVQNDSVALYRVP